MDDANIRKLFKKYIKYVGKSEGTWCLSDIYDKENFTEEEWNYLIDMLEEVIREST